MGSASQPPGEITALLQRWGSGDPQALDELAELAYRELRAIELRYFLGCTTEEAAELLGIGHATLDRDLQFAKSWLYRRLTPQP